MDSKKIQEGQDTAQEQRSDFSRRTFLQGVGASAGAVGVLTSQAQAQSAAGGTEPVGPDPVEITLRINGQDKKLSVEPRVTLLDALRNRLDYTGAKKVCDRATCGACTVTVDGSPVYSCTMLAIEAQGRDIQTVEGLASSDDNLHPVQRLFVEHDGQQCGFCTPGFVMAAKAFVDKHPNPSMEDVERGLSGNICRCGTYAGVRQAVYEAARNQGGGARRG